MNIVFFNNPVGTKKICFTASNESVAKLKQIGVIPEKAATLVKQYPDNLSDNEKAILTHIDKAVFDNYTKPTAVELDLDLIKLFFIDVFRDMRQDAFSVLDRMQIQAMVTGKTEVAKLIENDKLALRNIPSTLDYSKCKTFFDVNKVIPPEITVNYEEKYGYMLK
jgi:hypothetical protein